MATLPKLNFFLVGIFVNWSRKAWCGIWKGVY